MIDKADHRARLLYSTVTSIHGSELREEQLLTEGLDNYEKRSYYVVTHWVMIDVILPSDASEAMDGTSEHPTIIYALHAKKYEKGCFVDVHKIRTSYQVSLDRCFFETKDALYILMGKGIHQSMSAELVELLDTTDPAEI
jgi:hypothetical protein